MTPAQRWTLIAAILGSGIVFLDGTVVALALKQIGEELPATFLGRFEGQAYIQSGYFAVLAALLIIAGALSDAFGRRRVFVIGLVGFGMSSVLCGLAPTLELLVVARVLQGASGALLVPGSLAVIAATFDGPDRTRAFGQWAAATSGMILLGPIIGGLIVDTLSWRAAFLINVPFVAVGVWAALAHMPESRATDADRRFDWAGALVGAVAVGGLAFGAIRGQEREWNDSLAWASLAVGAAATILFPILMAVRPHPLVPLHLFRIREFAIINLATFLIYGALYVSISATALLYQGTLGYSATGAALIGIPTGVVLTLLSSRVGALAARRGARLFLVAGPLTMAAGQLWLARIPASSAPWLADTARPASLIPPPDALIDVLPSVVLFGLGASMIVAPLTSTLMGSVPTTNAGVASAINNALARVGQPLIGAVIFVAVSATFYPALAARIPGLDPSDPALRAQVSPLNPPRPGSPPELVAAAREASVDAFHLSALVSAGLYIAGAAANGLGLPGRPGRTTRAIRDPGDPGDPGTAGADPGR